MGVSTTSVLRLSDAWGLRPGLVARRTWKYYMRTLMLRILGTSSAAAVSGSSASALKKRRAMGVESCSRIHHGL